MEEGDQLRKENPVDPKVLDDLNYKQGLKVIHTRHVQDAIRNRPASKVLMVQQQDMAGFGVSYIWLEITKKYNYLY